MLMARIFWLVGQLSFHQQHVVHRSSAPCRVHNPLLEGIGRRRSALWRHAAPSRVVGEGELVVPAVEEVLEAWEDWFQIENHSVALEKDQVSLQRGWPPCCCTRCVKTVCEARWQIWTISSRRRTRRRRGRRSSQRQTLMCSPRTLSKWLSKRKRQWKRRSLRWIMTRPTPLSINRYAFLASDILWFDDPTLTESCMKR